MTVTDDRWTCDTCGVTELLEGSGETLDAFRLAAQAGHAARHAAERSTAGPLAGALLDAAEVIAAFRVRLVVAPADHERVRQQMIRRSLPVEVFADSDLAPGEGYVMMPRRGVRERPPSTRGDNRVDGPA